MRIATMATEGNGGYLAVKLAAAGHDMVTIARGAHLAAIRETGLTLEAPSGVVTVRPGLATDDSSAAGEVDAIIFAVKGNALETAAEACRPMLGRDTVVVPFLNGVEAADRLAAVLPERNVANGMARISTTIAAPGVIRQTGEFAAFVFAERDNRSSPRIDALRSAIEAAGASAPPTDDIERDVWAKFVLFAALSGVTAAGRCTVGDIVATPELAGLFRQVVAETAATGRATGVALAPDIEARTWDAVRALPPEMRASTAIDLEKRRPLEIDWIQGAAVRLAKAAGLDAPASRALHALLCPYRDGRRGR